jgi:hypothetical protein
LNIKKSVLIAGAVTGIGLAGITGLGVASAATNNDNKPNGIIDKIATKFNLNKDEVAQVFEEDRAERETERQLQAEERLTQAVADGKLTEEQKQKILAKQAELKAEMESMREEFKNKTDEERRELKKQHHEQLQQWAEDNDIPQKYLHFAMHGPGNKVMHLKDAMHE